MNRDGFWPVIIWIVIVIGLIVGFSISTSGCSIFRGLICKSPTLTEIVPQTPSEQGQIQVVKSATIVVGIALVGIGISVAATMLMPKFGFPVLVGCAGSLAASLAVIKYYEWIAILSVVCGLIGAICICLYIALVKTKAFKELVKGIQEIKTYSVEQLNGNKAGFNRLLTDGVQSPSTKKMVAETKTKMKSNGEI